MSFTTIATLLLLSCLCATGTSLHGLSEEPLQEEGILVVTIIVITKIRLDITAATATLQFCAEDDLPPGSPSLIINSPSGSAYTVDGSRDVNDPTCAIFIMDPSFTLPDVTTGYDFLVVDPEFTDVGRGFSTFAMTAKTTLLTCGTEVFTKVTWGDPTPIVYTVCLEPDPALLAEDVCYHKGDVWAKDFCFRIEDQEGTTIIICMSGLTSVIAGEGAIIIAEFHFCCGELPTRSKTLY